MLRARNISFYKMMLAGYISAKTYCALCDKKNFFQLSFPECSNYEPRASQELKTLFEDDKISENLACLDYLDSNIETNYNDFITILDYCTEYSPSAILELVNQIGQKAFLLDYLFCTEDCLESKYLVSKDNIESLLLVRRSYKQLLKDYIDTGALPIRHSEESYKESIEDAENSMVSEPFGRYTVATGQGFYGKDSILIDDDALGTGHEDARKYVLYIYSLSYEAFAKFESFMVHTISSCSVRTTNCIKALGFRSFLVNYLFANDTKLFQIRNFGRKSLMELVSIKPQIIDFVVAQYEKEDTSVVEEKIEREINSKELTLKERIGEKQYAMLSKELESLLANVSVRTQNGIRNYEGDFLEEFVNKDKDIRSIRNLGKKSAIEFKYVLSHLRDMLAEMPDRALSPEEAFWIDENEIYGELIDGYCQAFHKENGHLPMFHILENSINQLLKNRDYRILNYVIPFTIDEEGYTLEQVGQEHNMSRERIRQICVKAIKGLETLDERMLSSFTINALSRLQDWDYVKSRINERALWDSSELCEIVGQENCSLSANLLAFAMSSIFSDSFVIFGKAPLSITMRKNQWANTYLIKKTVLDAFDFELMSEIIREYEENNSESITLSIEELLNDTFYGAWKKYDYQIVEDLQQVIAELLIKEFSIIPDLNGQYTLEGMKEESTEDVLYGIVKSVGEPIGIDELFSLFQSKYPNRYKSQKSLRSIIYRDMRMTLIGMSNMVSLTEWTHIQTGSIRDLIVAFLADHKDPQHIKNIVTHILTMRDTSERSIYGTMASGDQFVRFAGGYFGLADRTYSEWFNLSEAERFAREKIVELEDFLKKEGHFPFLPSDNKDEEMLYRWWGRVKRQSDFTDDFLASVKRIDKEYSELPHNKSELLWSVNCSEYKKFIETNGRKPSEKNDSEVNLARWFNKALNDIAEGTLSSAKESLFIKLCHSL